MNSSLKPATASAQRTKSFRMWAANTKKPSPRITADRHHRGSVKVPVDLWHLYHQRLRTCVNGGVLFFPAALRMSRLLNNSNGSIGAATNSQLQLTTSYARGSANPKTSSITSQSPPLSIHG